MRFRLAITSLAAIMALPLAASQPAQAQFGSIGRALGNVAGDVAGGALNSVLGGRVPISTNIRDAAFGDPSKDGWTPPTRVQQMTNLARSGQGGFVLQGGYYQYRSQSYCLHAGTHGPGGGDGYLYAPVLGTAREAVIAILQNSVAHPEIEQQKIQSLLWAIVARAKFEDLSNDLKVVAAQLLTQRQIAGLNRNALDVLTSSQVQRLVNMPPIVRRALQAESDLRGMLTSGNSSYRDLEAAAMLAGAAPRGEGSIDSPEGRWNRHPDGYWVRYLPSGYTNTVIEVWVEPGSAGVGQNFDPAQQIAVPANTARQRLALSGRVYSNR